MSELRAILDARAWNEELSRRIAPLPLAHPAKTGAFLQSWEWGEFQRAAGLGVIRLMDEETMAQCLRRPLPLGAFYWSCPRGPLGDPARVIGSQALKGSVFLRMEPAAFPAGAVPTRAVQPPRTQLLDLRKSEEELLAGMHEKTRYNIRLAERKGVRVYAASGKDLNAFEIFGGLLDETTGREGFRGHDKAYYRLLLETVPGAWLALAEHDGKVLAASLMIRFGGIVTYLHGASSRERREVMAPHLLHWKTILESKNSGVETYDFWGIAPENAPGHPWAGFTRFKKGFGGISVDFPGTCDVPLGRWRYAAYAFLRKIRRGF